MADAGRPSEAPVSVVPGGMGTPIPETPAHLRSAGAEAWTRLWTVGRRWLSNEAHWDLMVQVCETLDRRAVLVAMTQKARFSAVTKGSMGQMRVNPVFEAIDKADTKVQTLLTLLRFPPAEQKQKTQSSQTALDRIRNARRTG